MSNKNPDTTGISRSGRVRKRSSKLEDFESSEESDVKKKTSPTKQVFKPLKVPINEANDSTSSSSSSTSSSSETDSDDSDDLDIKDEPLEYMEEWSENVNPDEILDIKDEDFDEFSVDVQDDSNYTQSQSLYFSEKKGKNAKDARNNLKGRSKAERKDKGQSRLTAYMLWAKATRPNIMKGNPNMDFPSINRKLGEMWATVPPAQKMSWKRKARQLLTKSQKEEKGKVISTGKPVVKKPLPAPKPSLPNKGKLQQYYRTIPVPTPANTPVPSKLSYQVTPKAQSRVNPSQALNDSTSPPLALRVTGTNPHDVAAHLKLLGESLNNIGQKLKEHEDQIAVSGSLSVLLDSMLCVLGPLACLTNQLDETRGSIPEETLVGILDNIAYIMPGIA